MSSLAVCQTISLNIGTLTGIYACGYIVYVQDEPSVIRKSLTLGYNLLNVGQVDNQKLGTVTVSVVFRPVPSVAKSGMGANSVSLSKGG